MGSTNPNSTALTEWLGQFEPLKKFQRPCGSLLKPILHSSGASSGPWSSHWLAGSCWLVVATVGNPNSSPLTEWLGQIQPISFRQKSLGVAPVAIPNLVVAPKVFRVLLLSCKLLLPLLPLQGTNQLALQNQHQNSLSSPASLSQQ
jgi:hypothetical protein